MKVLVAHADLTARGGAEAYAHALIERLRALGHAVSVLDINGLQSGNRVTRPGLFRLGTAPGLRRLSLWKYALVCRSLPRIARAFDAVVLSYGEGPETGRPTLRILHAPALFSTHPTLLRFLGARGPFAPRQAYAALCRWIARPVSSAPRLTTLANSCWTARIAARAHKIDMPGILYPEIRGASQRAGARDPHAMIAIGRIVPNKRLEEAIALTEALNAQGTPARLTIVGRADTPYAQALIHAHAGHPHVRFCPNASPETLSAALGAARIGLHLYRHEHFGIAIGEMIAAGVLPVVYDGGGARELVPHRDLRFRTQREAVTRVAALMAQPLTETSALADRLQHTNAFLGATAFAPAADAALQDAFGAA